MVPRGSAGSKHSAGRTQDQRYVPITAGCRGDCDNPRSTPLDTVQDWPLRTRYRARLNKYGGGLPLKHLTHFGAVGATRVLAVFAIAGSALLVGSPSSSLSAPSPNLHAAELVASRFIRGFDAFSYRDSQKHSRTRRSGDAGARRTGCGPRPRRSSGPALVAERFVATARVSGFAVENTTTTGVRLLAHTTEHLSTIHGSTTTARLVPVSLTLTGSKWRVADVGGIQGVTAPPGTNPNSGARGPTGRGFDCRSRRGHRRGCARCRRRSVELSDLDARRRRSRVPGVALGGPGRHRQGRIRLWRIHVARGELGFQRGRSGGADAVRTSDLPRVRHRCSRRERIPPHPTTPRTPSTRPLGCSVRMAVERQASWTRRSSTTTTPMPTWRWCWPMPARTSREAGRPSN